MKKLFMKKLPKGIAALLVMIVLFGLVMPTPARASTFTVGFRNLDGDRISHNVGRGSQHGSVANWVGQGYATHGIRVRQVQLIINSTITHGNLITVNASFDHPTFLATRDYQLRMGLAVDGVVGANTWSHMYRIRGYHTGVTLNF